MLVLWCPDWPAVAAAKAAGVPAHLPVAVFSANRVVACTAVARAAGVRRGMRRRDAQSRSPELGVLGLDDDRDARLFEPVAAAVEELVVGVEVVRPGLVAVPVTGAAGFFGRAALNRPPGEVPEVGRDHVEAGERRLVELLLDHVPTRADVECQIGIADGLFAATLAAHRSALVERGETEKFLAPLSIAELDQPGADRAELVDLLRRLGLRTLGAFAALSGRDVVSRFGSAGLLAHRLARGRSERPPHRRRPPPELAVTEEFDPPLERVDSAAFMAKTLAGRFHAGLAGHGLACTRLGIYAVTEHGEELGRVWRCAEPLTPQGIADRVRWQFEGWLRAAPEGRPTAGVSRLRLEPEETVEGRSLQFGLWQRGLGDEQVLAAEKAGRALVRVQGLLGPDGACTAVLDGGRGPAERVRLVPWGDPRQTASSPEAPWPGRLPAPSPATVFERTVPARLVDSSGVRVGITDRGELTAAPHAVVIDEGPLRRIRDWAGPWLVDTEWWAPTGPGLRTRVQALLESGVAVLLTAVGDDCPQWTVEGMYD
ncbi:DNA polymerase Y family protein [Amycolatopsis pigmentata]|uniref:DNA polymerase Y family protein n=1 Tax=Amycolatopsis pigmentata TaxID=450801 RepID=A0ABW5G3N9_9PSEU